MRVLIAIDGSDCSSDAVNLLAEQQWPDDTQFRIITVVEPIYYEYAYPGAYMPAIGEAQKEYYGYCNDLVQSKVAQMKGAHPKSTVTSEVIDGLIADSIIEEAKDWSADLIVVGSHGRKGFQKFLLGSVAEKVATHAPCSVEIIKSKQTTPKKGRDKQKSAVA